MFNNLNSEQIEITKNLSIKLDCDYHFFISGNKYRKLKYNVIEARRLKRKTLLTYGGAYSNHLAAVAAVGKENGFHTIGIIRGEELESSINENPTLKFCKASGMTFKFISREEYRNKDTLNFKKKLQSEFLDFYDIPEGGTNKFAIKGCEEILTSNDDVFDFICCPVGTGGTISGIINCSKPSQQVLGFPALKGDFLSEEISKFANKTNWSLIGDYHFGGYAKINETLIRFINQFKDTYKIPLDPIYTGKMMFGVFDLIDKGYFPKDAKILAIHTGGLQGIKGMNMKLKQKQMILLDE